MPIHHPLVVWYFPSPPLPDSQITGGIRGLVFRQAETLAGLDRGVRMPNKPTAAGRMVDACMSPARSAGSVL